MHLVVVGEAQLFEIQWFVANVRRGGIVEACNGFWLLGTHTFWVGMFICCFDGLVIADFVLGFVVAVAVARDWG